MRLPAPVHPFILLFVLSATLACGAGDPASDRSSSGLGMAAVPEATSLLGEDLYPLPTDSATAARLDVELDSAQARYEANPEDPDALIWVGRRFAYAGRYRDAIDAFTEGVERFPGDARFYRHRGHRYITVRELDRAVDDLEHATRMTSGEEDVVEPDGQPNAAGIPRSTLQTNIWYHLGLARFLQGRFEHAAHAFRQGFALSANDDMRVAMADWLWMALMRLGREEEAAAAIAFVAPEMDILENEAYHHRLLLYRGLLAPDALAADDPLGVATYGYGIAHWYLLRGDRAEARRRFDDVIATGFWPAFGYIAAEAELARWETQGEP